MGEIVYRAERPEPQAYLALFETTGWNDMYGRTADELARAVAASWRVECAYEDDDLVGVGRLVSDGVHENHGFTARPDDAPVMILRRV